MTNSHQTPHSLSLIKFTGADASSFLQGQLSNDINALSNTWQYSGYCSPKGRLLALFQLWKHHDVLYGLLPSSLVESCIKRLRMYVMRSKVTIDIVENVSISCDMWSAEPRFKCRSSESDHVLSFGGRNLIISTAMTDDAQYHDSVSQEWLNRNIVDGLPEISDKTTELFVPQMVNLDLLDGINFKKGCYTGQEIVARMHYLGKLKQRMFLCRIADLSTPSAPNTDTQALNTDLAGAKVLIADKTVGHIVINNGNAALAVLRIEFAKQQDASTMVIENASGKKIGLSVNDTQPYSLELSEAQ